MMCLDGQQLEVQQSDLDHIVYLYLRFIILMKWNLQLMYTR